jgi:hypothetical protein
LIKLLTLACPNPESTPGAPRAALPHSFHTWSIDYHCAVAARVVNLSIGIQLDAFDKETSPVFQGFGRLIHRD